MSLRLVREAGQTRLHALARGVSVYDVTDHCRRAVHAFLAMASRPVTPEAVASWLLDSYRVALLAARVEGGPPRHLTTAMGAVAVGRRVDEADLREVVLDSSRRISSLLEWCRANGRPSAADELVARGLVERVTDETGSIGYAPTCRPRMPLRERLLALVLADFLTRPSEFVAALYREADGTARIEAPPPRSAIVAKKHDTMPWGLFGDDP